MLKVKATLKLGAKSHDEDYDSRKRSLKEMDDAISSFKKSMEDWKGSVKKVADSLLAVQKSFTKLSADAYTPTSVTDFLTASAAAFDRIKTGYCVEHANEVNATVLPMQKELKKLRDECKKLQDQRSSVVHEYDVYREEVSKKESDYAKRGKNLSESKSYATLVQKRDSLKVHYDGVDAQFKQCHNNLIHTKNSSFASSMSSFFKSSFTLFNEVTREFCTLYNSSLQAA